MTDLTHAEPLRPRYYARSASDKTDNWPFWFIADRERGGLNVTSDLMREHYPDLWRPGAVFMRESEAKACAAIFNKPGPKPADLALAIDGEKK